MQYRATALVSLLVILSACGVGEPGPGGGSGTTTSHAPGTITTTAAPADTTSSPSSVAATAATTAATTTTTQEGPHPAPTGRLDGTLAGWPDDAVACSALVTAWGPGPYREQRVDCGLGDPAVPVPFSFDLLPAGEWGIRVLLSWIGPNEAERARFGEFPPYAESLQWYRVEAGKVTEVDLVADAPGGGLRGRVIDSGNGLPITAQWEPGAPLVQLFAFGRDGSAVGGAGNGCDGTFTIWAPAGEVAVAALVGYQDDPATRYWLDRWAVTGAAIDPLDLSYGLRVRIDPALIPPGEWIEVADGVLGELDVVLDPGPGWPDPHAGGWYPWWVPPVVGEPLAADAPERRPGFWTGRSVRFTDVADAWPPVLMLGGQDVGLVGCCGRETGPGLVTAWPAPPEGADGNGGEPASYPAWVALLALDGGSVVRDALVIDLGPEQFVALNGYAPHAPGVDYTMLGRRNGGCGGEGPAERAWELAGGRIVEVDPTGISVSPPD